MYYLEHGANRTDGFAFLFFSVLERERSKICPDHAHYDDDANDPRKDLGKFVPVFSKHSKHKLIQPSLAYMQEFKKHHTKTRALVRFSVLLVGTLFLFVTAGVAVSSAWGMYGTFTTAATAKEDAEKSLKSLQEDEARIRATVAALASDIGIEKEVRERFGVVRQGEGEIQIVRNSPQEDLQQTEDKNIFMRALHSLFVW